MDRYDYRKGLWDDILRYFTANGVVIKESEKDEKWEELKDLLWDDDTVTGNGSGSYTFSRWDAEDYLAHNLDLLVEACTVLGMDIGEAIENGAEFCDVTIRCYLLGDVLSEVIDDVVIPDDED